VGEMGRGDNNGDCSARALHASTAQNSRSRQSSGDKRTVKLPAVDNKPRAVLPAILEQRRDVPRPLHASVDGPAVGHTALEAVGKREVATRAHVGGHEIVAAEAHEAALEHARSAAAVAADAVAVVAQLGTGHTTDRRHSHVRRSAWTNIEKARVTENKVGRNEGMEAE
jgi:hypothetical protein